ncbi:hypothetical protein LIER_39378 [Lithospermum erythrorhizon]|uniref:Reverse transcriptase zinc-binding domain-containing protein n=1 Tax=Lithospermum erythrorhizon TaxID=34254 RepID=A0AAV3QFH1_LITER
MKEKDLIQWKKGSGAKIDGWKSGQMQRKLNGIRSYAAIAIFMHTVSSLHLCVWQIIHKGYTQEMECYSRKSCDRNEYIEHLFFSCEYTYLDCLEEDVDVSSYVPCSLLLARGIGLVD